MERTATLSLRVDPAVKSEAENVLDRLGISMSTAINVYLRQIALTDSIPFPLQLPRAPKPVDVDRMGDDELAELISMRLKEAGSSRAVSLDQAAKELLA